MLFQLKLGQFQQYFEPTLLTLIEFQKSCTDTFDVYAEMASLFIEVFVDMNMLSNAIKFRDDEESEEWKILKTYNAQQHTRTAKTTQHASTAHPNSPHPHDLSFDINEHNETSQ